jgi:hypothetical protein
MNSKHLAHCFNQYDQLLSRYLSYWQFNPFACIQWPWQQSEQAIQGLVSADLANLPQPVCDIASGSIAPAPPPFWLTNGIQGRKLAQITGFIAQFDSQQPVLEWCAGKGHLGRLLSAERQLPVTSLEWQTSLCQQGQLLAQRLQLPQQFQHCDVMALPVASLPSHHSIIALHACGDLHRRLLEQFTQTAAAELFVAPCCYHLQADSHYQPMSVMARQSSLRLAKSDLKLAVQDFVTAGQRTARLRATEQLWRLVFQLYRAEVSGDANYQPLPALSKQMFSTDVMQFISWACQLHNIPEPTAALIEYFVPLAHKRLQLVHSLDQVRQLFRRPLELWLLLDRALFLQQQGYQVRLQQFCRYQDSPRNTMIIAKS